MGMYSSLEWTDSERQFMAGIMSQRGQFVCIKINDLWNFLEQLTFYSLTASGHLKSCWGGYHIGHICTLRKKPVGHVKELTLVTTWETLPKWEPLEVKYSKF